MKSRLIILLIVFWVKSFSQIPDVLPVNLSDVQTEVSGTSLTDCFTKSNSSYFNATYSETGNTLKEWRDYGSHNSCPGFVSIGTPSEVNSTSLNVAYPSTVLGDILIINVLQYSSSTLTMTTAGWTSLGSSTNGARRYTTYYKKITSSTASGNANFTVGAANIMGGVCIKLYAKPISLINKNGSTLTSATNSYLAYSVISGNNCNLGLEIFGTFSGSGSTITTGSGWIDRGQSATSNFAWRIATYNFYSTISSPQNTYNFSGTLYFNFEQLLIN